MAATTVQLYTDGGARGNPGPAAIGGIMRNAADGSVVETFRRYLGERTNNQAEYEALLEGLIRAKKIGATHVECFLDSQLIVEQMNRTYRVKDHELAKLFVKVWNAAQGFSKIHFRHIPREHNVAADCLVNQAIDEEIAARDSL
ncbi:MAG: ribonuclease HI family protein [bacterium]